MFNALGQQVKQMANISVNYVILSRADLSNGLYFVQLIEDGKTIAAENLIIGD